MNNKFPNSTISIYTVDGISYHTLPNCYETEECLNFTHLYITTLLQLPQQSIVPGNNTNFRYKIKLEIGY